MSAAARPANLRMSTDKLPVRTIAQARGIVTVGARALEQCARMTLLTAEL